jgi:hypothetical protein
MASFTDQISQFNPYVSQLPIDAMVKVGMYKQQQYDQGVQKVQSYIDNVAGLDVTAKHKEYLQSKLNQLGSDLRTVAAGDFSNQQLVNSVTGMASQIVKDPTIQTAVYSAQRIKKGMKEMEDERKAGTFNPNNGIVFNDDINKWYADGDLANTFRGDYSKAFDIPKFTREYFDKIKPGGYTTNQIFKTDSNGDPVLIDGKYEYSDYMTTKEVEGNSPAVVKAALSAIMSDGRVRQQLSIDGRATYRGYTPEALNEKLIKTKDTIVDNAYDDMLGTLLYKTAGYKTIGGKDIDEVISSQKEKIENTTQQYDELAAQALSNPDAVKAKMYTDDFISNNTTIYGAQKVKTTIADNPAANFQFKLTQEANKIQMDFNKMKNDNYQKQLDREQKTTLQTQTINAMLLGKTLGGKNAGSLELVDSDGDGILDAIGNQGGSAGFGGAGGGTALGVRQGQQSTDMNEYISAYESGKETAASNFKNAQTMLIWNGMMKQIPGNQKLLQDLIATNPGVPQEQLISQLVDRIKGNKGLGVDVARSKWVNETMTVYNRMTPAQKAASSDVIDSYNKYVGAQKAFTAVSSLDKRINADVEAQVGSDLMKEAAKSNLPPLTGEYQGQKFTLSSSQQHDLALFMHANFDPTGIAYAGTPIKKAGDAAARRLTSQGLGFLLDPAQRQGGNLAVMNGLLLTGAVRGAQETYNQVKSGINQLFGGAALNPTLNWGNIINLANNINGDVIEKTYTAKSNAIKTRYAVQPNLEMSLLTGDTETDKNTIYNLREFAATYKEFEKNLATKDDVSGFNENIQDKDFFDNGGTLQARVINAASNNPLVEIVLGTPTEGRKGALVLSKEEAMQRGINPDALYEPGPVKAIRDVAGANGGKTTPLPDVKSTDNYYTGNTWLNKGDFPLLAQYPYDVRANLFQQNGKWYGQLYIQGPDGKVYPRTTPGNENLSATVQKLQKMQAPQIDTLLKESNGR